MPNRNRAPWAKWHPIGGRTGGATYGSARKITLHTTESPRLPSYAPGFNVPHLTVNPETGSAWQHVEFNRSAYALASPGYPRSPNMNAGERNIQIEIIGYARDMAKKSDEWYEQLGQWLGWLCDEHDIAKRIPFAWGGSNGYGYGGAYRVSWSAFSSANGIVGHSNAPYNTHWDPGALSKARLLDALTRKDTPTMLDKDAEVTIARAVNRTLGDWTASGDAQTAQFDDGQEDPKTASVRLRQVDRRLRAVEDDVVFIRKALEQVLNAGEGDTHPVTLSGE